MDSRHSAPPLQGDILCRISKMGIVVVKGKVIDPDQFFGSTNALEESIDESFDKTGHDFELEADEYLQTQTGQNRPQRPFNE